MKNNRIRSLSRIGTLFFPPRFRVPMELCYDPRVKSKYRKVVISVYLPTRDNRVVAIPCRLDSGADFTTLPLQLVTDNKISYWDSGARVYQHTSQGKSQADFHVVKLSYRLCNCPQVPFSTTALLSPHLQRGVGLLSLNDLVRHFHVGVRPHCKSDPKGSVVFRLRRNYLSEQQSPDEFTDEIMEHMLASSG